MLPGFICALILYHADTGFLAPYAGDASLAWFVGIAIAGLTPPNTYFAKKEEEDEEDT
jgi:hypothetical protein